MSMQDDSQPPKRFSVLGIPVSAINLKRATALIGEWANGASPRVVFVREVASLMAAVDEPRLAGLHHKADLVVADGTPLVWVGKIKGYAREVGRVPGADLVDSVCSYSLQTGQSHYFYGGQPGVAAEMARRLCLRHPGLKVAGVFSPPMRSIGPEFILNEEIRREIAEIEASGAGFVWVGISSPKQEYWMTIASSVLRSGVLLGVGAAFDFHAGTISRAPAWMRNNGLEWLHRLLSEPRRLWRRYLIQAPRFAALIFLDLLKHKPQLPRNP